MRKESLFNEMTFLEKRRKDKAFGKYVNSVKNTMKLKNYPKITVSKADL